MNSLTYLAMSLVALSGCVLLVQRASTSMFEVSYDNIGYQTEISDSGTDIENETTAAVTTPVCHRCEADRMRKWQIEIIKASILEELGMTHPPNINRRWRTMPEIPLILKYVQQYTSAHEDTMFGDEPLGESDYGDDTSDVMVERVLIMVTDPPEHIGTPNSICFNMNLNGRKDISTAQLLVYVRKAEVVQSTITHLNVYRVIPTTPALPMKRELYKQLTISLSTTKGSWKIIDAKQLIKMWLQEQHQVYHYLQIEAQDSAGNDVVETSVNDTYSSVLSVEFEKNKSRYDRSQSNGHVCRPDNRENVCCLETLTIDFTTFGWDWIVAPKYFNANTCSGKCTLAPGTPSLSTHVMQGSITKCCSPSMFAPLNILYVDDDGNFIIKNVSDMKVVSCHCS